MDIKTDMSADTENIKVAWRRYNDANQNWVEAFIELMRALYRARVKFERDDNGFGTWFAAQEFGGQISHQDRAAFINLGEHEDIAIPIIKITDRRSPRYIWEEAVKPIVDAIAAKKRAEALSDPDPVDNEGGLPTWVNPSDHLRAEAEKAVPAVKTQEIEPKAVPTSSPLISTEEDVVAFFTVNQTRATVRKLFEGVSKKARSHVQQLFQRAIDDGFLKASSMSTKAPSLRLLLPDCVPSGVGASAGARYAATFDLSLAKDRQRIDDDVWPAITANREAYDRDPYSLETIVREFVRQRSAAEFKAKKDQKIETAKKAMPSNERPITIFGESLWPRVDERFGIYDFAELETAKKTFDDLWAWMWREHPKGRAIQIRQSVRWYTEHADATGLPSDNSLRTVWRLIHVLAKLGESSPKEIEKHNNRPRNGDATRPVEG